MVDSKSSCSPAFRPPIAILGVPFDNITLAEAVGLIDGMVESGHPHHIVTPNVDFLIQARSDCELRRILMDAHLVLCDGMPLVWVSRFLGNSLPERVAGADLVPALIQLAARKNYRVFFLGGAANSVAGAVTHLRVDYPGLQVAGYSPPFDELQDMDHDAIMRRIAEFQPHFLFVSFGCPKQEKWLAMHHQSLGVPVCVGVGGTIDFLAGRLRRAPVWMQRIGTEWLFRLAQEPRRLFRRYAKDLVIFGEAIGAQWWQLRGGRKAKKTWARLALDQTQQWTSVSLGERLDFAIARDDELRPDRLVQIGRPCLLGLEKIRFVDSAGVAWLMRLDRAFRAAGQQLSLLAPSRAVMRALRFMRLEHFFAMASDMAAAREQIDVRQTEVVGAQPAIRSFLKLADVHALIWD